MLNSPAIHALCRLHRRARFSPRLPLAVMGWRMRSICSASTLAMGAVLLPAICPAHTNATHELQDTRTPPGTQKTMPRLGYLGISMRDMDAGEVMKLHLHGAVVTTVDRDAPAWTAGLRPHDIIVAIDGQGVDGLEPLRHVLRDCTAEQTITLHVWHEGNVTTVPVTLGDEDQVAARAMDRHVHAFGTGFTPDTGNSFTAENNSAPSPASSGKTRGMASSLLDAITPTTLYSGLTVDPLTPQLAQYFGVPTQGGLLVTGVSDHSPAATAGLLAGDVLMRADNRMLRTRGDLEHALRAGKGDPTAFAVLRDKHTLTILMTPAKHKKL